MRIALITKRSDLWLIAAIVVAAVGLCWQPSWWMIATMLFTVTALLFAWQRISRRYDGARKELNRLRTRIHEFGDLQRSMVGVLAHELKTPLAIAVKESDLLLLRSTDAKAVKNIAKSMAAEVRHLSDLVESFLQLTRSSTQQGHTVRAPLFVSDLVVAAAGRCSQLSKRLEVHVVTMLCEPDNGDPSAEVLGDAFLLEAMVATLLRNAIRFSPPGSEVKLMTLADAKSVTIIVRDHGIGMPCEQQESVFGWFFDGPSMPSKTAGNGFGLAIARRVVSHHGGTIAVTDTLGGGCELKVTLPRFWSNLASSKPAAKTSLDPPISPKT